MRVTISDIAAVLALFEERYQWVDVFASDVTELAENSPVFRRVEDNQFQVQVGESLLELTVYPADNIARFGLARNRVGAAVGELVGAFVANSDASRPRELQDIVLGLLIGRLTGRAIDENRIMMLVFNPATHDWRAYDGPYESWARSALRPAV